MCLFPKLIRNKKYTATKKNGGIIPPVKDKRVMLVPIGCGECMECRKQKKREWQFRLIEEVKTQRKNKIEGKFVTLTFREESLRNIIEGKDINGKETGDKIEGLSGYELDNEIATRAVKKFLERWRKKYKKSLRHWFITELGHTGTERIHLHGFVWSNVENVMDEVERIWSYGYVWKGKLTNNGIKNYVNEKTINYTVKYVHKVDEKHRYYKSKILCSPGIGQEYTNSKKSKDNVYNGAETKDYYKTEEGYKVKLNTYWRNKLFTEDEREEMWLRMLDKKVRYVAGKEIDISKGEEKYYKTLKHYQKVNQRLGYGSGEINWEKKNYENQRRELAYKEREIIKEKAFTVRGSEEEKVKTVYAEIKGGVDETAVWYERGVAMWEKREAE